MQTGGSAEVPVKIQSDEENVVWLWVLDRLESAFQKDIYEFDWSIIIATISFIFQIFYIIIFILFIIYFFYFWVIVQAQAQEKSWWMPIRIWVTISSKTEVEMIHEKYSTLFLPVLRVCICSWSDLHFLDFNQYVKGND